MTRHREALARILAVCNRPDPGRAETGQLAVIRATRGK